MDADNIEYEKDDLGVGFINGNGTTKKHEHRFVQVQPYCVYRKRGVEDLYHAMLYCECGETKEIIAESRGDK